MIEDSRLLGEFVESWGGRPLCAIEPEMIRAQGVDADQDHRLHFGLVPTGRSAAELCDAQSDECDDPNRHVGG